MSIFLKYHRDIINKLNHMHLLTPQDVETFEALIQREIDKHPPTEPDKDWTFQFSVELMEDIQQTWMYLIEGGWEISPDILNRHKTITAYLKYNLQNSGKLTADGLNPKNPTNLKPYIGTKHVKAMPLTRGQYNRHRGWQTPLNEDPNDKGFLVMYMDGGIPNHPDHDHYISWSPNDVFTTSYSANGNFNFGDALFLLKQGSRVMRSGWNGKNMFVAMEWQDTETVLINDQPVSFEHTARYNLYNVNEQTASSWVPSSNDLNALDWSIFPEN